MKRLNLIPKDIRYGFLYRILVFVKLHQLQVGVAIIVLFLLSAFTINIIQVVLINKYEAKLREQEKALDIARVKGKNLNDLSEQYKKMASYLSYVNSLVQRQLGQLRWYKESWGSWALTLIELKKLMPKRVWFYNLETKDEILYIEGGAFSDDQITAFMSNVRGSTSFSDVQFAYTQKASIGAAEVINFKISCKYNTRAAVR